MPAKYTSTITKDIQLYCNNMGVVKHGSNPYKPFPERQPQADIFLSIQYNLISLSHRIIYKHVFGHSDSRIEYSLLTIPEQLNTIDDKLAQECLLADSHQDPHSWTTYLNEPVHIHMNRLKVTSFIKATLYNDWGHNQAMLHLHNTKILHADQFNLIFGTVSNEPYRNIKSAFNSGLPNTSPMSVALTGCYQEWTRQFKIFECDTRKWMKTWKTELNAATKAGYKC